MHRNAFAFSCFLLSCPLPIIVSFNRRAAQRSQIHKSSLCSHNKYIYMLMKIQFMLLFYCCSHFSFMYYFKPHNYIYLHYLLYLYSFSLPARALGAAMSCTQFYFLETSVSSMARCKNCSTKTRDIERKNARDGLTLYGRR